MQDPLGAQRVHGSRLAYYASGLGDTVDYNKILGLMTTQNKVDSQIFEWLRETFLPQ